MKSIEAANAGLIAAWQDHEEWIEKNRTWETGKAKLGRVRHELPKLCPMQYPNLALDGIVLVGFNPSFSAMGWQTVLARARKKGVTGVPTLTAEELANVFRQGGDSDALDQAILLEGYARQHLDFYSSHNKLFANLGLPCTHIDLFAWRHTNQAEVERFLVSGSRLTDSFSQSQLHVFDSLLDILKPKAVVLANALAAEIYLRHRPRVTKFDVLVGHYWDKIGDASVPVHPAGMLTGQRALDRYSRQRLFWQLARSLPVGHRRDWDSEDELVSTQRKRK